MPFFKTPWLHHNVACSFSKRSFLLRFGINVASPLADGSIAVQASAPILARRPAHAARLVRTLGKWESGKVESGKEVGKWERGKVESG